MVVKVSSVHVIVGWRAARQCVGRSGAAFSTWHQNDYPHCVRHTAHTHKEETAANHNALSCAGCRLTAEALRHSAAAAGQKQWSFISKSTVKKQEERAFAMKRSTTCRRFHIQRSLPKTHAVLIRCEPRKHFRSEFPEHLQDYRRAAKCMHPFPKFAQKSICQHWRAPSGSFLPNCKAVVC